jgi:hypothetical protein
MANVNEAVFNAMLKEAETANFRAKMASMPPEDEILREHPLSEQHNRKMSAIFAMERRRNLSQKMLVYAKAAAIFICISATLTAALLMTNPEVRATVKNAIVSFFEGFTRVEFTEPHDETRNAWDFSPQYIPDGYELTHSEILGSNYLTVYEDDAGNMLILDIGPPGTSNADNEHHVYYTEEYDGIIYHIHKTLDDNRFSSVRWEAEGFMFIMQGSTMIETLLDTSRSVEYIG